MWRRVAHLLARARLGHAARPRRAHQPPVAHVGRLRARDARENVVLARLAELVAPSCQGWLRVIHMSRVVVISGHKSGGGGGQRFGRGEAGQGGERERSEGQLGGTRGEER